MSNIYLKITKKNWRSQNFDFWNLKKLSPGQFLNKDISLRKIPDIVLERRILCFSSFQIKSKTMMSCSLRNKKRKHFLYRLFCMNFFFLTFVFYVNVWCIEHTLTIFYISKSIASYTFLLFFKIRPKPSVEPKVFKERNFITLMIIVKIITMKIKVVIATKKILLVLIIRIMILRRTTITTTIIKIIT